jgi:LuxR family maltose regulon positive regulatory protein
MDQGIAVEPAVTGRRIIERPRLTQLLDGVTSPLILLVAPAGYGKTTLAHEWLGTGGRRALWYDVTPAATDVAVLAASIAEILGEVFPEAARLMTERLRARAEGEADPDLLADALAAHIPEWPPGTWLVFDDYQHLMDSVSAESFVSRLAGFASILIVSRRRPKWLTARGLLYGAAREFGENSLAMTDAEAAAVLRLPNDDAASGLVSLASGWPAVIGLAALTPKSLETVSEGLPETLHDYFAEELFRAVPEHLKTALAELSLAPVINVDVAAALTGRDGEAVLHEAAEYGFLGSAARGNPVIHPLLRRFLRAKLNLNDAGTRERIESLASHLVRTAAWDEAFQVIVSTDRPDLLSPLMGGALADLLRDGRIATIRRWLAGADERGVVSPQLDLAKAEVSFREGRHAVAEMQALEAARGLSEDHLLYSRALYRAAQSAQLGDRASDALQLHREAARTARTTTDQRQAIWGQFVTRTELGQRDEAFAAIAQFERSRPSSIEDKLRQAQAYLSSSIRWGGIGEALRAWRHRLELVHAPGDPVVKTGFLQMLGTALVLGADYAAALAVADLERREAEQLGLDFVVPHALCMYANAETGLRRHAAARKTLRAAFERARALNDNHSTTNARVIEAKLLLAQAKPSEALSVLQAEPPEWPNFVMQAEFFGMRALVAACGDEPTEAFAYAKTSATISDQVEAALPALWAVAIADVRSSGETAGVLAAYDRAQQTGHLDSIVSGYRAFPPILTILGRDRPRLAHLLTVMSAADDYTLAKRFNLPLSEPIDRPRAVFTRREREVAALLCQGFSNAQIGRALWIEESTAKVHVQHILRKLNVRSRTEAALRIADEGLSGAT